MNPTVVRKFLLPACLLLIVCAPGLVSCSRLFTRHSQPQSSIETTEGAVIRVPEGFTIERVAGDNLAQYPMLAALDDRGRLFVAESSGKNVSGKKMAEVPECRISVLEDTDGDGVYDRSKVFADKLSLPMGVLV